MAGIMCKHQDVSKRVGVVGGQDDGQFDAVRVIGVVVRQFGVAFEIVKMIDCGMVFEACVVVVDQCSRKRQCV